jgi:hypothetical protein
MLRQRGMKKMTCGVVIRNWYIKVFVLVMLCVKVKL